MKNLFGSLKVYFSKTSLILVAFALFTIASCKQNNGGQKPGQNNPGVVENVTITVTKDANVKSVEHTSFTVAKGSELGLTDLQNKIGQIGYKSGFGFSKICLGDATGEEITNANKHKFDADSTIFVVSQKMGKLLKSLRIGTDTKTNEDTGNIKAGIATDMEFAVPFYAEEVKIEVKGMDEDVAWEWRHISGDYPVEHESGNNYKLQLKKNIDDVSFLTCKHKLVVTKGEESETYDIKVIKMVTNPFMEAGLIHGVPTVDRLMLQKIITHDPDIQELLVSGPELLLDFWSQALTTNNNQKWKAFIVNVDDGDDKNYLAYGSNDSHALARIPLEKDMVKTVTIRIESNPVETKTIEGKNRILATSGNYAREEFKFKVRRDDKTVDFPADHLFVSGLDILEDAKQYAKNIYPDLWNATKPLEYFRGEPCALRVKAPANVTAMTIDNVAVNMTQTNGKDGYGRDVYDASHDVTGFQTQSKKVTIVMTPESTTDYHETTWNLQLTYTKGSPIEVRYDINALGDLLSNTIKRDIESDRMPLIPVHGNACNLFIASKPETGTPKQGIDSVEISSGGAVIKTLSGADIFEEKTPSQAGELTRYIATCSIKLDGTNEKDISVVIKPKNKTVFSEKKLSFKVKGDGQKTVMKPVLKEIAKEVNFTPEFLNSLTSTDESQLKVHTIAGTATTADIEIELPDYDHAFLCKKLIIDTKSVEIKRVEIPGTYISDYKYIAKTTIEGISENEKIVEIKFEAKEGIADDLTWKFKIKNGNTNKPSLPQKCIAEFTINGQGKEKTPFPIEFKNGLATSAKPTLEIYGKKAIVKIIATQDGWIQNVEFKLGNELKATQSLTENLSQWETQYEFDLAQINTEYEIEVKFNSAKPEYSALVYSFKVKSLDEKQAIPDLEFFVNQARRANGYAADLNVEYCEFVVRASSDVMNTVEIGQKANPQNATIMKLKTQLGAIYEAKADIQLDKTKRETYIIKVNPKNAEHATITYEFNLKGKEVDASNAEFELNPDNKRLVTASVIEYVDKHPDPSFHCIGTKKIKITAKTLSPKAKVKYKFINPLTGEDIQGQTEHEITNKVGRTHTSEDIVLLENSTTRVKVWVESENGKTDDFMGLSSFTLNPLEWRWGYAETSDLGAFTDRGYDEIKFDPAKVKDGKIYILVVLAKETEDDYGYTLNADNLPTGQTPFVEKGELGFNDKLWLTSIDVSDLIGSNPSAQSKEAFIKPQMEDGDQIQCMTYKIKVMKKN